MFAKFGDLRIWVLCPGCLCHGVPEGVGVQQQEGGVLDGNPAVDFGFRNHGFVAGRPKERVLLVTTFHGVVAETS